MNAVDNIVAQLDGAKQSGDSWSAKCPAHEDRSPSLSVTERTQGDPGAVVHCHAGCTPEAVLSALGMTTAELFDKRSNTTQRPREVAAYPYTDESGVILFEAVRYAPKDFRQRRVLANGDRVHTLGDVRRVLYRLPQVIEAVANGQTIYVVEGEKDADAIVQAGAIATCSPMGAGKWSRVPDAADVLRGAEVVIVIDNDVAGHAHGREVAASLIGIADTVTVTRAVIGKDAADHLGAGRTLAELELVASNSPALINAGQGVDVADWALTTGQTRQADIDIDDRGDEPKSKAPPARDALVDIAEEHYVIGRLDDERTYLVPHDGPNVALLRGEAKADLARRYRALTGKTTGRSPLDEAWMTIEGIAHTAPKLSLPLRVGSTPNGSPVIDLADTTGRAIVASAEGWSVVDRSPITFRRSKAMLPLDEPVTGGNTMELFELLNIDPSNRDLFAAWMTSALFDTIPHPAPVLTGTQGTTKSSTARAMTKLIDPCLAATQKPPKSDDEWAQTCAARWMVAVDNVSNVSEWWSDAVCRTITGDGWLRRSLYTDDDVVATSWRRCVILNGITLGATLRPDLAERLVLFELQRPTQWLTEREVDARLDDMRPRVLGALLDLAVSVIKAQPTTETVRDLRMADFATFLAAHDTVTGADALKSYRRQLDTIFDEALESDAVAVAVVEFMEHRDEWSGNARQLLAELIAPINNPPEWPTNARQLSNAMSRSAAMLHKVGITWQLGRKTKAGRLGTLTSFEVAERDGDEGDVGDDKSPLLCLDVVKGGRAA